MINSKETYCISVDQYTDGLSITIAKVNGDTFTHIRTMTGLEAMEFFSVLDNTIDGRVIIKDYGKAFCPRCDNGVYGHGRINYCPRCSQKLKWPNDNINNIILKGGIIND